MTILDFFGIFGTVKIWVRAFLRLCWIFKGFSRFFEIFGTVIWIGALYQTPELEGDGIICQKTEFFFI